MHVKKEHLDKRICDVEADTMNSQTYREYIRQSEEEFGLEHEDIDHFDDEKLNEYLDFLDDLWTM